MIKPILFNTDMVRAILADRKTVTRRALKGYALEHLELDTDGSIIGVYDQSEGYVRPILDYAPYRPSDILYVREAFQQNYDGSYSYRAGHKFESGGGWRPSIHMPREAARIFLRVTKVWTQRLRNVTEADSRAEGFHSQAEFMSAILKMYPDCTPDSWFWVNEFERCEKPKEA